MPRVGSEAVQWWAQAVWDGEGGSVLPLVQAPALSPRND